MQPLATISIACSIAALTLWPAAVYASKTCGDFLSALEKKPASLEFIECKRSKQHQVTILLATYRVAGADAAKIEAYFELHARMPRLRFYCCNWEIDVARTHRYGLLRDKHQRKYEVEMNSDETLVSSRKNWSRIEWFHVQITLPLEEA